MAQTITISPVTRIEGHAKVTIDVDDAGAIARARMHVVEFRGFEKVCEGRPFYEMPALMARVCGICPVSHVLAASKAGDAILGVAIPPAALAQRRLANCAQVLQSHALSFFHLSAPDLLLGWDTAPEKRNVFGLIGADPEFTRRGIRLRQFGQEVIKAVGGQRIHPSWSGPGGVRTVFTASARDQLRSGVAEAYGSLETAFARFKGLLDKQTDEIAHMGDFPSLFLGMVDEHGRLDLYDGKIRIVDAERNIVADGLDPARYHTYLGEASESWSYTKFPFYKPLGYPGGMYRVGPLARLNVADTTGTPRADRELREFRHRASGAVCASFYFHLARLIEMLHTVERIEELLDDPDLTGTDVCAKAMPNRRKGVGVCEAPRGTLFHHFEVDDAGLVTRSNLLIATGQNNGAMNLAVTQAAKRFVDPAKLNEAALNRVEAAIRCFDPCLSCSTHAIGQMPLIVEVQDATGNIVNRVTRE